MRDLVAITVDLDNGVINTGKTEAGIPGGIGFGRGAHQEIGELQVLIKEIRPTLICDSQVCAQFGYVVILSIIADFEFQQDVFVGAIAGLVADQGGTYVYYRCNGEGYDIFGDYLLIVSEGDMDSVGAGIDKAGVPKEIIGLNRAVRQILFKVLDDFHGCALVILNGHLKYALCTQAAVMEAQSDIYIFITAVLRTVNGGGQQHAAILGNVELSGGKVVVFEPLLYLVVRIENYGDFIHPGLAGGIPAEVD